MSAAGDDPGGVEARDTKLQNELLFRGANEDIRRAQEELGVSRDLLPFLCECYETRCRVIVQMHLREYESVRAHTRRFLITPGHACDDGRVVERGERFWVLEKS